MANYSFSYDDAKEPMIEEALNLNLGARYALYTESMKEYQYKDVPVMKERQQVDANGDPVVDENGAPVMEQYQDGTQSVPDLDDDGNHKYVMKAGFLDNIRKYAFYVLLFKPIGDMVRQNEVEKVGRASRDATFAAVDAQLVAPDIIIS